MHTPGPWFSDGKRHSATNTVCVGVWANGGSTCVCGPLRSLEDARLIAAAPELLNVLKRVAATARQVDASLLSECYAAIRKATGGDA